MQLVIRGRETPALRRTNVAILSTVVRAVCAVIVLGDYDTVGINRVWGMFPNAIDDGVISSEGDAIAGSHVDYVEVLRFDFVHHRLLPPALTPILNACRTLDG